MRLFPLAMMVHVIGSAQINPNIPMLLSSPPSVPVCRSWVAYNMSESALAVVSLRSPFLIFHGYAGLDPQRIPGR